MHPIAKEKCYQYLHRKDTDIVIPELCLKLQGNLKFSKD